MPCRTPGCPNTWTWKRGAQLAEMQRTGKLRRPSRLCAECFTAERETHDVELPCKIDGCKRTWTWTRDAQLRHRLWVLRQRAKADAAAARANSFAREDAGREREARDEGDAPRSGVAARENNEGGEAPRGRGRDRDREGEARARAQPRGSRPRAPIDRPVTVERALPFLPTEPVAGSDVRCLRGPVLRDRFRGTGPREPGDHGGDCRDGGARRGCERPRQASR